MPPDANDFIQRHGLQALVREFDRKVVPFETAGRVQATPYVWVDPTLIPPRAFLLGRYLCRDVVSITIAPGGVGKSALALCEAMALATGRDLLDQGLPAGALNVWYWNLEDPRDELTRRIQALCAHYELSENEFKGRLFIDTGVEQPLQTTIPSARDVVIDNALFAELERTIRQNRIDVVIIDPFVSSHTANENDNGPIDRIVKAWAGLATRCKVSVSLVHHTRKAGDGGLNTESARGAKSLTDAARCVRVLERMPDNEAACQGLASGSGYFSVRLDKQNFSAPQSEKDWFCISSVLLGEGNEVGVIERFQSCTTAGPAMPDVLRAVQARCAQETWRANIQAHAWVGHLIAEIAGLKINIGADKRRAKALQKQWTQLGFLKEEKWNDTAKGCKRPVIRPGKEVVPTDDSLPHLENPK